LIGKSFYETYPSNFQTKEPALKVNASVLLGKKQKRLFIFVVEKTYIIFKDISGMHANIYPYATPQLQTAYTAKMKLPVIHAKPTIILKIISASLAPTSLNAWSVPHLQYVRNV
jgi:hypothetical protein